MLRRALAYLRSLVVTRMDDEAYPRSGLIVVTREPVFIGRGLPCEPGQVLYVEMLLRVRGRKRRLFLTDYNTCLINAVPLYWLRLTFNCKAMRKRWPMLEMCRGIDPGEHPDYVCQRPRTIRYYPPTPRAPT